MEGGAEREGAAAIWAGGCGLRLRRSGALRARRASGLAIRRASCRVSGFANSGAGWGAFCMNRRFGDEAEHDGAAREQDQRAQRAAHHGAGDGAQPRVARAARAPSRICGTRLITGSRGSALRGRGRRRGGSSETE